MSPNRLDILDGMRGHLLLGMMVAHLHFAGAPFIGNIHHVWLIDMWDAEFFVLISGALCGVLSFRKYGLGARLRDFLLARAWLLYLHVLFGQLFFLFLVTPQDVSWGKLFDLATLQEGSYLPAVLELYFFCFILLCLVALAFRNIGWVMGASLVIYVLGQYSGERGVFGFGGSAFNIASWQFLFMLGFGFGRIEHAVRPVVQNLGKRALYLATIALFLWWYMLLPEAIVWPIDNIEEEAVWLERDHMDVVHLVKIFLFSAVIYLLLASGRENPLTSLIRTWFSLPVLRRLGQNSLRCFTFHVVLVAIYIAHNERWGGDNSLALALALLATFIAFPYISVAIEARVRGWRASGWRRRLSD